MDGNGRWAKRQGLPRVVGHEQGLQTVKDTITACVDRKVKILTLFAFGIDNWQRPRIEVEFLMKLFARTLINETKEIADKNIQLRVIGDKARLPVKLQQLITKATNLTANNDGMILNLAVSYSGQWDIIQATKALAAKVDAGELSLEKIDETAIANELSTAHQPDPDLLIRTSGEFRISNFLLWQLCYTELYFTDVSWPDFNSTELDKAIAFYIARERRFGKISEQLAEVG